MQQSWLYGLFFLAAVRLTELAIPFVPSDDVKIKHTWHAIPANWETLGHPYPGSAIDFNIVLQPDQESALIDAVSDISNQKHSRHVILTTPTSAPSFTCAVAPLQISHIPFE